MNDRTETTTIYLSILAIALFTNESPSSNFCFMYMKVSMQQTSCMLKKNMAPTISETAITMYGAENKFTVQNPLAF